MRRPISLCPLVLLFAVTPALAIDRAKLPSEGTMEACPSQGAGFAKIPGTSTCIRISGRVAAGIGAGSRTYPTGTSEGRFAIDSRTDTDMGPMRSFVRVDAGRR